MERAHIRDVAREEATRKLITSQNKRFSYLNTKEAMFAQRKKGTNGKKQFERS